MFCYGEPRWKFSRNPKVCSCWSNGFSAQFLLKHVNFGYYLFGSLDDQRCDDDDDDDDDDLIN